MKVLLVTLLLCMCLIMPTFASSQTLEKTWSDGFILAQNKKLSPSEAAKLAQQQYGGKVVSPPKCRETDSGTVCTVRLDIDGRIKTVTIRG